MAILSAMRLLGLTPILGLALLLAAPAASPGAPLKWRPPLMSGATTIAIDPARTWYDLNPSTDYVLRMPSTVYPRGGLTIRGGRNVTLIGGHISVPETGATTLKPRRGLLLLDQRGRIHVEGLRIDGPGLSEGIDLGQIFGSTVVLENIYVGTVRARDEVGFTDNHPDVVQTWAGPKLLLIDRLSGATDFQGLFLAPDGLCATEACVPSTVPGRTWHLQDIDIIGTDTARVLYWNGGFPLAQYDLWGQPSPSRSGAAFRASIYPSLAAWPAVTEGTRPARFVPPSSVGLGYRNTVGYE